MYEMLPSRNMADNLDVTSGVQRESVSHSGRYDHLNNER